MAVFNNTYIIFYNMFMYLHFINFYLSTIFIKKKTYTENA